MPSLIEEQLQREDESAAMGKSLYDKKVNKAYRGEGDKLVFIPELNKAGQKVKELAVYIDRFKEAKQGNNLPTHRTVRQVLKKIDSFKLAYMTIRFCFNHTTGIKYDKQSLQNQCIELGKMIETEVNFEKFEEKMPGYLHIVMLKLQASTSRHKRRVLTNIMNVKHKETIQTIKWNAELKLAIGYRLIEMVVGKIGLFEVVDSPVRREGKKPVKVLVMKQTTLNAMYNGEGGHEDITEWLPRKEPMVCPPKDWTTPYNGGYLMNQLRKTTFILNTKFPTTRNIINERLTDVNKANKFYDAINSIQRVPWKINGAILDIMKEFKNGGEAGIPDKDLKLILPKKPWKNDREFALMNKRYPERVKAYNRVASVVYDDYHRATSKRSAFIAKIRMAEKDRDRDKIYFPIFSDWRTRNYPETFFLTPQGDDLARGLLLFAEGKQIKLSDAGHSWLAIHAANCYGEDKCSFEDRVKWVQENHLKIKESVENPTGGEKWWTEADKPFQFLAVCMELVELWAKGSVISHIPVQMDGTCNGLQNFSMLMQDEEGGKAVNLTDAPVPSDIYTEVLKVSQKLVEADSVDVTLDEKVRSYAQAWLKAGLTRKLAKRNTMTLPYGASKAGFTDQLISEVRKLGDRNNPYLPEDIAFKCCHYLADINRKAIGQVVVKSIVCMEWMQKVTLEIAKSGNTVRWTTPFGIECEQRKVKQRPKCITTYWGNMKLRLDMKIKKDTKKLDTLKMRDGVVPNFIHSLDASHLLKTVACLKEKGIIDVSMIHDSYGVHAVHVDQMRDCIRETFVNMYSGGLLDKFYKEIKESAPEIKLEKPPELGNLDPEAVLKSTYFFA